MTSLVLAATTDQEHNIAPDRTVGLISEVGGLAAGTYTRAEWSMARYRLGPTTRSEEPSAPSTQGRYPIRRNHGEDRVLADRRSLSMSPRWLQRASPLYGPVDRGAAHREKLFEFADRVGAGAIQLDQVRLLSWAPFGLLAARPSTRRGVCGAVVMALVPFFAGVDT